MHARSVPATPPSMDLMPSWHECMASTQYSKAPPPSPVGLSSRVDGTSRRYFADTVNINSRYDSNVQVNLLVFGIASNAVPFQATQAGRGTWGSGCKTSPVWEQPASLFSSPIGNRCAAGPLAQLAPCPADTAARQAAYTTPEMLPGEATLGLVDTFSVEKVVIGLRRFCDRITT